jgi:hypothetical protein
MLHLIREWMSLRGRRDDLICFLLLYQNTQGWVIYEEKRFILLQGLEATSGDGLLAGRVPR